MSIQITTTRLPNGKEMFNAEYKDGYQVGNILGETRVEALTRAIQQIHKPCDITTLEL